MGLIETAYMSLFGSSAQHSLELRYSGKFKGYNGNIKKTTSSLTVSVSKRWRKVDDEILIGLIQHLLAKVFRDRKIKRTLNMDLYDSFIRNVHVAVSKTLKDPVLESSFNRVNEHFFDNLLDMPNLAWNNSVRTLGTYEYSSDTIKISSILANDLELVDYVMFHEMLHKKHKFRSSVRKTLHHSKEFRLDEKSYPGRQDLEKRLSRVCRSARSH